MMELPVNDVRNTVVKNGVGEYDLSIVHVSSAIGQDGEGQVGALERWDGDVPERWREDDVIGDDVVLENCLERLLVGRFENRANGFKCLVLRHKDSEVGDVQAFVVGSGQANINAEVGSFEGSVESGVPGPVCPELERRAER